MLTSLQYKCVNKQTNKHAESESEVFSKSESADSDSDVRKALVQN
jgi:hypothetical protein